MILPLAALVLATTQDPRGGPPQPPALLELGDPAPAWTVDTWLHGERLAGLERGQVYYVEFWATWCAPCIASFPHLSQLQARHAQAGLVVVGVSIDVGQPVRDLRDFAREQHEQGKVDFRLAWDSSGAMKRAWLDHAQQVTIPAALIVDRAGRVVYAGPAQDGARALPSILAGEWDLESARARRQAALAAEAEGCALTSRLTLQFLEACDAGQLAVADELLGRMEQAEGYLPGHDQMRLRAMLQDGDREAAMRLARHRVRGSWRSNAEMLGVVVQEYAFHLEGGLNDSERALVWRAAARVCAAPDRGPDSGNVERKAVLALAHVACEEFAEALILQREVLSAMPADHYLIEMHRQRLERIEAHLAPRRPR